MKKILIRSTGAFINLTAPLFPSWNGKFTFDLLCRVRHVGFTPKGKEFIGEAHTVFLDVDGQFAALHKWGNGPKKLLFMHGWLSNSQRWLPYVNQLNLNQFTVYALDAPGHGMAKGNYLNLEIYRAAYSAAITHIGEVDTVACHSLGSLVSGYGFLVDEKLPVGRYVIMGTPSGVDALFVYFENILGLSKKAISNLEQKINSVLQLPHNEISIEHFFRKVEKPVLVVHDQGDTITPFEPVKLAARSNRSLNTHFVSGQDHNLRSKETVDKVLEFITE